MQDERVEALLLRITRLEQEGEELRAEARAKSDSELPAASISGI
jgi:hypothetical protein